MIQTQPVFYTSINRMFTGNYLRWVFLFLFCLIVQAALLAQTFQVAGGIPYFPAYNNTAAVTLSPIPPGAVIYDKSQAQLQMYTGSSWVSLCSANIPSTSNISTAFRIMNGIPVLSVTNLSTTATAGATYLNTSGSVYVGDGSAWNTLNNYMNKTNVTTTNPARMGAVAGTGSALVIPVLSVAPTATAAGAAYFDAATADLKVYNGSSWTTLSCIAPPVAINVTATGLMRLGDVLGGTYTYTQAQSVPEGTSTYQWYYANGATGTGKTAISGATGLSYTVASPAVGGKYVAFEVKPVTNTALAGSPVLSPWRLVVTNAAPVVTALNVTGCFTMGSTLKATATIVDIEGNALGTPIYKWYVATDATGAGATAISGATATTYTVASPVVAGNYVRVGVTPTATAGTTPGIETFSAWKAITANAAPYFSSVTNSVCIKEVNWTASAAVIYTDCESNAAGAHRYQWYRYTDAYGTGKVAIAGATASTYTFTSADLNKYINVGVTPVATAGTLLGTEQFASTYLGPIKANTGGSGGATGSFTVTHYAGSVAPATKTVTYGVALIGAAGSEKCWITRNLGADRQATSYTDSSEPTCGWFWQYNEKQGHKIISTSSVTPTSWNTNLSKSPTWSAAKDPCLLLLGSGWHIPTYSDVMVIDQLYASTPILWGSVLKWSTGTGQLSYSNGNFTWTYTSGGSYGWYYQAAMWSQPDNTSNYGVIWQTTNNGVAETMGLSAWNAPNGNYGAAVRCVSE